LGASLFTLGVLWDWGTLATFASLGLLGLGLGPAASTSLIGPQTRAPWHHRGMVTSALYATRMLGGTFTIAAIDLVHGSFALRFALVAAIAGVAALVLASLAPGRVVTEASEAP
ncbi:MAG TPA: MFS transporter, partial [Archangium sp.]